MPILLKRELIKKIEDNYADKVAAELAYLIEREKKIRTEDLYGYGGVICAYDDAVGGEIVRVSWTEICDTLNGTGEYLFDEKYVQLEYDGKRKILRVN